jgi:hypothetical protein
MTPQIAGWPAGMPGCRFGKEDNGPDRKMEAWDDTKAVREERERLGTLENGPGDKKAVRMAKIRDGREKKRPGSFGADFRASGAGILDSP